MHTTNNVPQSRCRAFLIYGELSEMGRWSKRRWRHAEGLHFSLFSPHKQEKPVSVCHNTLKHTPTHCLKTRAHTQTQTCTTPTIYTHTLPLMASLPPHANTHTIPPFSNTIRLSPATTKHTWIRPPPTHAHIFNQKLPHNQQPLTDRHTQANPQGLTGPD